MCVCSWGFSIIYNNSRKNFTKKYEMHNFIYHQNLNQYLYTLSPIQLL